MLKKNSFMVIQRSHLFLSLIAFLTGSCFGMETGALNPEELRKKLAAATQPHSDLAIQLIAQHNLHIRELADQHRDPALTDTLLAADREYQARILAQAREKMLASQSEIIRQNRALIPEELRKKLAAATQPHSDLAIQLIDQHNLHTRELADQHRDPALTDTLLAADREYRASILAQAREKMLASQSEIIRQSAVDFKHKH